MPGVTTKPIVVTEIDWSPGEIVYDEFGKPVLKYDGNYETKNYGTWGTASTSKWGNAFKAVKEHFGNISMNLTSTDDYVDMEHYLKTGEARPSFSNRALPAEACGYACWDWYKKYSANNKITCQEAEQVPFYGEPLAIPGKIEAEDFDNGGEGVSFHDEERANNGDSDYRKGYGVDIKNVDGNIRLGWTVKGEWLEYTVNIAEAGRYTITTLVSTDNDEASFHFLLDDEVITDEIKAVNTGDWNTLVEVKADTKELPAGEHVLKLYIDNSYFDIDWFSIVPMDPTSVADVESAEIPAGLYHVTSALGQSLGSVVVDGASSISDKLSAIQPKAILFLQSATTGEVFKVMAK